MLHLGDTIRLTPRRLDRDGDPIANDTAVRFLWESSDTTVVMVDEAGLAEIVGLGEASVTLRVADRTNLTLPSTTDTASAMIQLGGAPAVIHPGPLLAAFTDMNHQCVLLANGRAECRGRNHAGQTGTGTVSGTTDIPAWTPVSGELTFSSISGSSSHTCALTPDGRAYCWGDNSEGQLGLGGTVPLRSPVPVEVGGGHRWLNLHAHGHSQTCGVTTANVPLCVGHNDFLQVGRLPQASRDTLLAEWGTGHRVATIRTDDLFTCGVQDGAVFCSGRGGPYTNTSSSGGSTLPNRIGGTVTFTTIALGIEHGCGLDAAGAAHCWGFNQSGQLGTGDVEASGAARAVVGGLTFSSIYALEYSTCGVTTTGETWCWGSNRGGMLGRTRLAMTARPIRVNIGLGARAIDRYGHLGATTTCAIDSASRLVCWGLNQPSS